MSPREIYIRKRKNVTTMGMSSSQARLLTLTGRLHSIERKAQKLEAEKLRLANDSDRVYENYLRKLDSTKVQYGALTSDGSMTYIDATLARLENGAVSSYTGETSNTPYLLCDANTNTVFVTPEFAAEYGITDTQAESLGTLEDYLTNHGCTKEPEMTTVTETNYNDIQSVKPVSNNFISDPDTQTITDADTYSIQGNLSSVQDNSAAATTNYNVTGTNPSVNSVAGVPTQLYKTIVSSGVDATDSVKNVTTTSNTVVDHTSTTIAGGQTYSDFTGVTYQYDTTQLNMTMKELSDLYNWDLDFTDTTCSNDTNTKSNEINVYYDNKDSMNEYLSGEYDSCERITYTEDTTLNELLTQISGLSNNITYNQTTGTLSSSEQLFFISIDDEYIDNVIGKYLACTSDNSQNKRTLNFASTEKAFSLDTVISDYRYSNKTVRTSGSQINTRTIKLYNQNLNTNYNGSLDKSTMTYRDYFDYLKETLADYNFDYQENDDGSITYSIDGDYTLSGMGNLNSTTTKTSTKTNDTAVEININAIVENLYLARSIINGTSIDDYNANHDNAITTLTGEMQRAYLGYPTDESKRQLLLFSEQLSAALATGDVNKIQEAYNKLGQTITSDDYKSSTTTDANGNKTVNNYTFTLTSSNSAFTPNTKDVEDGSIDNPGTLTVATNSDMQKYLAYQLYQANSTSTYEEYLSNIQSKGYNAYQLAELVENFDSYKTRLIANENLASSLTKYNSTSYTLNQSTTDKYNVQNNSTAATYEVTVANTDDILDRLAYDVYTAKGSGNPNTIKTQLSTMFNATQLASLNSYYGTSDWTQIVNKLSSNMNASSVSAYTTKYNGYNITYGNTDNVQIVTTQNSHTVDIQGQVNIPTIEGIASNLAIAFRKAGYTVDETELKSKLTAKYGTDNATNNITLANINDIIVDYINNGTNASSISNIYGNIYNNTTLSIAQKYNTKYDVTRVNLGVAKVTYGTTSKEVPTGNMVWVKDDNYNEWYSKYMQLSALQGRQFKIVDADVANSSSFVSNWISEGGAFLLKFEQEEDGSYNLLDTSVSVETSLQEVSDEVGLKKAEAEYEADMKKIDRKDSRYDTEIAKLETERTAIVDEMDTLKTVAKDNVERTFKLFS